MLLIPNRVRCSEQLPTPVSIGRLSVISGKRGGGWAGEEGRGGVSGGGAQHASLPAWTTWGLRPPSFVISQEDPGAGKAATDPGLGFCSLSSLGSVGQSAR